MDGGALRCVSPAATADGPGDAPLRVSLNGVDFPATMAPCADTPGWTNGERPGGALGCEDYVDRGFCAGGFFAPSTMWARGEAYRHPEAHCCACGKVSTIATASELHFGYFDEPRLVSLSPSGGPIAGRTAVTIVFDAPLPLFAFTRSVCRFGDVVASAALSARQTAGSGLQRTDGSAVAASAGAAGGLVCLAPPHAMADVQVTVTLNGQQYTRSDHALYSALPSAGAGRLFKVSTAPPLILMHALTAPEQAPSCSRTQIGILKIFNVVSI